MVHKSLNTHGTLLIYLLCRLLTVSCLEKKKKKKKKKKKTRFGEIINSGSQSNSKVQSALSRLGTSLKFKQTKPGKTKTIPVNVNLTRRDVNEILLMTNGFSI